MGTFGEIFISAGESGGSYNLLFATPLGESYNLHFATPLGESYNLHFATPLGESYNLLFAIPLGESYNLLFAAVSHSLKNPSFTGNEQTRGLVRSDSVHFLRSDGFFRIWVEIVKISA